MEVKRSEVADTVDPDDLTGSDEDATKPTPNNDKREVAPETNTQRPQEDLQLKKALEILKDKPGSSQKAA